MTASDSRLAVQGFQFSPRGAGQSKKKEKYMYTNKDSQRKEEIPSYCSNLFTKSPTSVVTRSPAILDNAVRKQSFYSLCTAPSPGAVAFRRQRAGNMDRSVWWLGRVLAERFWLNRPTTLRAPHYRPKERQPQGTRQWCCFSQFQGNNLYYHFTSSSSVVQTTK